MPGLRDLLRKKENIKEDSNALSDTEPVEPPQQPVPEFKFIRSTTSTQESISPPSFPDPPSGTSPSNSKTPDSSPRRHTGLHFRKSSKQSTTSPTNPKPSQDDYPSPPRASAAVDTERGGGRRLSARLERFHLGSHSRSTSASSIRVPEDLPEIERGGAEGSEAEAEWERRALLLAERNARGAGVRGISGGIGVVDGEDARPRSAGAVDEGRDVDIQEAVRLHESGDLERATRMFASLASPTGSNNALAQVLYGLSLRHGWGCTPSPQESLHYLSLAASSSASIESAALASGYSKGGSAKGELVLAIFELGNSFRYGWGCDKDPVAARRYYETAAELGDTDAMNEAAWCYLEGYGGKKDKSKAARYLRLAEKKGIKTVGNSWIWQDKYDDVAKS